MTIAPPRNALVSYHYFKNYDLDRLAGLRLITGRATVAYRPTPGDRIVGLSKLARVVHGYARRLQVQERIGHQVLAAIMSELQPSGAAVIITAAHDCMRLRGVNDAQSSTTTTAQGGLLTENEWSTLRAAHWESR